MRVHHIGYLVKNIKKAIKSYEVLGFNVSKQNIIYDESRKCYICFVKNENDICVEFIEPKDETSPIYNLLKTYKNTPYHLCFESECLNTDIDKLKNYGWKVFVEQQKAPAISNKNVVFLINVNSGIIELVEK